MSTHPSASRRLARFVMELRAQDIPESSKSKTRHCVLDWLGGAWNASGSELAAKYRKVASRLGAAEPNGSQCTVIGSDHSISLPLPWAVFANAALGHIAETDDGHRPSIMHPGAVVIPVALALAEVEDLSGSAIMESIVSGYEVELRIGRALGAAHYRDFHTTATAGPFGAAAAAGKALGLDEDRLVWALGHAGTQASGLWQFLEEGIVEAKPFHPAKAALAGVIGAQLAASGVAGPEQILEGDRGLLHTLPAEAPTLTSLDDVEAPLALEEVNFKAYPTCGQSHSTIDALRDLLETRPIDIADVQRIEVDLYRGAMEVAGIRDPRTLAEAKFSIPFCVAFVLARGPITFDNLPEDAVTDPAIRDLMSRVELRHDPELDREFPASRPSVLRIHLAGGETLEVHNHYRRGDPERPLSDAELETKFRELTSPVLPEEQQQHIVHWCRELESFARIEPFVLRHPTE